MGCITCGLVMMPSQRPPRRLGSMRRSVGVLFDVRCIYSPSLVVEASERDVGRMCPAAKRVCRVLRVSLSYTTVGGSAGDETGAGQP